MSQHTPPLPSLHRVFEHTLLARFSELVWGAVELFALLRSRRWRRG
jgi:hypothetical protein